MAKFTLPSVAAEILKELVKAQKAGIPVSRDVLESQWSGSATWKVLVDGNYIQLKLKKVVATHIGCRWLKKQGIMVE